MDYRRRVSRRPGYFVRGEVTFEEFLDDFYDSRDPVVSKLVNWIENEPRLGNFFGVSDQVYFFIDPGFISLSTNLKTDSSIYSAVSRVGYFPSTCPRRLETIEGY